MGTLKSVTGAKTSRSETVGVRLDPKLRYLTDLAAREQQRTTSSFIEWCIRRVLTQGYDGDEPRAIAHPPKPMMYESVWDIDEEDRFYKLATTFHGLLTIPEQRLWKLYSLGRGGKQPTVESFREFWNSPSINTTHLKEGSE